MARRPTDRKRKEQLIAALAASRDSLRIDREHIKRQINPLVRVRSAIRNKPLPVFAATAGTALLLTFLFRRRKQEPNPFSARRTLLGWALALAKPAARFWLANWARDHFLPLSDALQSPDPAHTP